MLCFPRGASPIPGTYPDTIRGVSGSLSATASFSLSILTPQTINFAALATQSIGTSLPLAAAVTSGLPVSYTSATPAVCTVSGATATFLTAGACSITAARAGSGTYTAAAPVSQSFAVVYSVPVEVNLSSVANVNAFFSNGAMPTNGGFDSSGYAYSANFLGSSLSALGVPFTLGASGVADAVSSTTIPLPPGLYTSISFLATGNYGGQPNATFVLNFADGSTSSFKQSISDWGNPQAYPGETVAAKWLPDHVRGLAG